MKKGLLATSALVGASLLGAPAMAAAPTVADNLALTIVGTMRSTLLVYNQDQAGGGSDSGRGFTFRGNDESEIRFLARGRADNGLSYGFDVEVQTQTNDSSNADEVWFFIESPTLGRVEIGDQDDAPDRMMVNGEDAQAGRGGMDFDVSTGDMITLTDISFVDESRVTLSGDASKIIYFTPRWAGFQFGASFTPDTGQDGGDAADDGNDDFEDVIGFGINYQNTFSGARVTLAGIFQTGTSNDGAGGENEDLQIWGFGGSVVYAGFTLAAGYVDAGDTGLVPAVAAAGVDAGQWWDIGLMYTTGPWDFSVGYFSGWASNAGAADDSTNTRYAASATYRVAPGWVLAGDIIWFDVENRDGSAGDDVDGWMFVLSSTLTF